MLVASKMVETSFLPQNIYLDHKDEIRISEHSPVFKLNELMAKKAIQNPEMFLGGSASSHLLLHGDHVSYSHLYKYFDLLL